MRTKTKTTTKPKAPVSVQHLTSQAMQASLKADPVFRAIMAYDVAHGRCLAILPDMESPKACKLYDALSRAEVKAASTVPTTVRGMVASARWFNTWLAAHDGIDGHPAVAAWHKTVALFAEDYGRGPDPVDKAIADYVSAARAYSGCDERKNPEEGKRLGDEHIRALHRLERTLPMTPQGLARSLEAFYAEAVEDDLAEGQIEWLKRLVAAARALA